MSSSLANDNLQLIRRGRFEGVLNVVRFNWPLYVVGAAIALAALGVARLPMIPSALRVILIIGGCLAIYLLGVSLLVSWWIYDLSPLYRFDWAARFAGDSSRQILNLHSGFDETSPALRALFPPAQLDILELHDPARMTEASIARARRFQERTAPPWLAEMTRQAQPAALPLSNESIDTIFAILSLHEVRIDADRQKLFAEITRILRPAGRLILIEHLRNPANFLVFGPQFVHFYSRSTWLNLAQGAGLALVHESRITPFIGFFIFEKPQGQK